MIEPSALTAVGTATLLGQRSGAAPAPEAARAAYEVTGGNPFFLGEVGAALRTRPHDVPATVALIRSLVRHALLLRLGRLGASVRATAEALAVLGDDAAVSDVAAVADRPRDDVLTTLARLAASGLSAAQTVTRFAHPIIRTAILSDLTAPRRALLHERAARALQARDAEPERVAHHLLGA
ncbi:MAG: LuxR family transcriptional regulator, partial [Actinomycetota bacterium]|nr:LuxR family transcriptional regulator [Actinomycetota bacterium]